MGGRAHDNVQERIVTRCGMGGADWIEWDMNGSNLSGLSRHVASMMASSVAFICAPALPFIQTSPFANTIPTIFSVERGGHDRQGSTRIQEQSISSGRAKQITKLAARSG